MAVLSTKDLALLLNELQDVTDPFKLGINLGIDPAQVRILLKKAGEDVYRQKSEVLEDWLNNNENASWGTLARTLMKIGYAVLSRRLANKYVTGIEGTYIVTIAKYNN